MEFEFHCRGFERRLAVCFVLSPLHRLPVNDSSTVTLPMGTQVGQSIDANSRCLTQLSVCVKWATPSNPMMGLPRFPSSPVHKLS